MFFQYGSSSLDQIENQVIECQKHLAKASEEYKCIQTSCDLLAITLRSRDKSTSLIFEETCEALTRYFSENLRRRGWRGQLKIDDVSEQIDILVEVARKSKSKEGAVVDRNVIQDLKSLSGGERSFTSVCLVMALGREIRSPFMLLDEFDVFMDADNR